MTYSQSEDVDAEIEHVVVTGENLTSIANTFGLTVDDIATANNLDPGAFLQVGQRLRIVFPVAVATVEPEATASPPPAPSDQVETGERIVPNALTNGLPAAPVAMADAPGQDLLGLDPIICFALFLDENRSGALDPGEDLLPGGEVSLSDGVESVVYAADDIADIYCIEDLQRQIYTVTANAASDYSLTSSGTLRIDLRDGMPIDLYFGATPGLARQDPALDAPTIELQQDDELVPDSLLGQISGLFVVGLAAVVLVSGFALALFLRLR